LKELERMHTGSVNVERARRAILAGALALLLPAVATAADDLLAAVKTRGSLRIGLEGSYPPFNFKDPKTGELTGYDVDVARLLASRLGLKPVFVATEWTAILAGLGAGKYDVIVSQVGITPRRQQAFDFSQPYTYSTPQLIVRVNEPVNYTSLAALKGRKLGVGQGSVFEQQARAVPGIDVKSYPAAPENMQDLAFGRIDAALNDSLMVAYLLKHSQLPIRAGARVGAVERMGVALRKGNPALLAAIDKALADARADGSLKRISMTWFGVDATRAP
jgi:cystine transport system substrate-binding protein